MIWFVGSYDTRRLKAEDLYSLSPKFKLQHTSIVYDIPCTCAHTCARGL